MEGLDQVGPRAAARQHKFGERMTHVCNLLRVSDTPLSSLIVRSLTRRQSVTRLPVWMSWKATS